MDHIVSSHDGQCVDQEGNETVNRQQQWNHEGQQGNQGYSGSNDGVNQRNGVNQTNGYQTNGYGVDQTNGTNGYQTNGYGVDQTNGSVVNQTNGTNGYQINGSVVNQTNGYTVDQTNGYQTNGYAVDQTNGSVVNQTNGTNGYAVDQTNGYGVNHPHNATVDGTNDNPSFPSQQTIYTPPSQTHENDSTIPSNQQFSSMAPAHQPHQSPISQLASHPQRHENNSQTTDSTHESPRPKLKRNFSIFSLFQRKRKNSTASAPVQNSGDKHGTAYDIQSEGPVQKEYHDNHYRQRNRNGSVYSARSAMSDLSSPDPCTPNECANDMFQNGRDATSPVCSPMDSHSPNSHSDLVCNQNNHSDQQDPQRVLNQTDSHQQPMYNQQPVYSQQIPPVSNQQCSQLSNQQLSNQQLCSQVSNQQLSNQQQSNQQPVYNEQIPSVSNQQLTNQQPVYTQSPICNETDNRNHQDFNQHPSYPGTNHAGYSQNGSMNGHHSQPLGQNNHRSSDGSQGASPHHNHSMKRHHSIFDIFKRKRKNSIRSELSKNHDSHDNHSPVDSPRSLPVSSKPPIKRNHSIFDVFKRKHSHNEKDKDHHSGSLFQKLLGKKLAHQHPKEKKYEPQFTQEELNVSKMIETVGESCIENLQRRAQSALEEFSHLQPEHLDICKQYYQDSLNLFKENNFHEATKQFEALLTFIESNKTQVLEAVEEAEVLTPRTQNLVHSFEQDHPGTPKSRILSMITDVDEQMERDRKRSLERAIRVQKRQERSLIRKKREMQRKKLKRALQDTITENDLMKRHLFPHSDCISGNQMNRGNERNHVQHGDQTNHVQHGDGLDPNNFNHPNIPNQPHLNQPHSNDTMHPPTFDQRENHVNTPEQENPEIPSDVTTKELSQAIKEKDLPTLHQYYLTYLRSGDYDNAVDIQVKAIRIYQESGDKLKKMETMMDLGDLLVSQEDKLGKALTYYKHSLKILNEKHNSLKSTRKEAEVCSRVGSLLENEGKYDQALQYYHKALLVYDTMNDSDGIASTLKDIAVAHAKNEDWQRSTESLEKALMHVNRETSVDRYVDIVMQLGITYTKMGKIDIAIQQFDHILTDLDKLSMNRWSEYYYRVADAHIANNNIEKAKEYYNKAHEANI